MEKLTDIQAQADLSTRQLQRQREANEERFRAAAPYGVVTDAFTGEVRPARSRNHYEPNDGKPVAPHVDTPRPTVRQRIENLLNRGQDPLAAYVRSMESATEGIDMEIPDDGDAPLTASEQNYLDVIAASLAEQAPLPDDGLPRPPQEAAHSPSPAAVGGAGGSSPPAGGPSGAGQGASSEAPKSA